MLPPKIARLVRGQAGFGEIIENYENCQTVELTSLSGSAFSLLAAEVVKEQGGIHVFVAQDKDAAAYLANDFYVSVGDQEVMFLPTGYKRSIQYNQEDPSGIVQRTGTLNAIKNFSEGSLIVCTWPEALLEKVTEKEQLRQSTISVSTGEQLALEALVERLIEDGFERVDFVHDPGQYSVRGGIIDVFSFSENQPYRLDFFGDEVDSIRLFEIGTQLSIKKLDKVEIIPNLKSQKLAENRVSFAQFTGKATYWIDDLDYTLKRFNDIRVRILKELDEPSEIDQLVTGAKSFIEQTRDNKMFLNAISSRERMGDCTIDFGTTPQPSFNKQFELLADDIWANQQKGYTTYILSENRAQIERLRNILDSIGKSEVEFSPLPITLHQGFVSESMRVCFYTDHQIFERYHRYKLSREIDRSEALTVSELNSLKIGDYVVHIDHGVGRFGGLVKTNEGGKIQESVKLLYKDNDVLFVNVHALHRIARYKDRDAEPPRIYKLGSGAWQRMKERTKKAVKDIARELVALYARRKATPGYAFSADTYMQEELEASFIYEDTPDQVSATEAVKADMENKEPMDRLICGDVGFGKTEIAIRAAFKAVNDSKQVAVLVPTTILSLQHYRTFNERLKGFPIRIEHLSRVKTAREAREITADLKAGKIDILIGTHRILGKTVEFNDLGLLIIDEEQKFGVASKERLRRMSVSVDTLTLTATPIPRTLQFSLMGSRDLSIISTPPANRQPIVTEHHLFDDDIIGEAIDFEMARKGQLFFLHNRVKDIEKVAAYIKRLRPGVSVVVGHGQMKAQELEKKIMDFIYSEYDIMVATTIIENGIDIPNANTIIINNAHHFGLSELHQLRGRVGRSNRKAFCYLLSPPDEMLTSDARRRLRALEEFNDLGAGFNIAMQDLDIRGAGNLLGAEQSGFIADIGFETYHKILNEAMDELRAEGVVKEKDADRAKAKQQKYWLRDPQIDTDSEAFFPDSYISQSTEKIRLYRQLENIVNEESLQKFESDIKDRFGELPRPAKELLSVVRLKWLMMMSGFERAILSGNQLRLTFIRNQESPYYKSDLFMDILHYVTQQKRNFIFRQDNNILSLRVKNIDSVESAIEVLKELPLPKTDGENEKPQNQNLK